MTPRTFIDDVAHVNSARYLASKNNLRLAINAVVMLDTAIDVLFSALQESDATATKRYSTADGYKDSLAATNHDYALVRRLAEAVRQGCLADADVQLTQAGPARSSRSVFDKFMANRSSLNSRSVTISADGKNYPADEIILGTDMLLTSLLLRHDF